MKLYEAVDKRFLTMAPNQGGSIAWDVAAHQNRTRGTVNTSAGIDLTDCNRKISLEFYWTTGAEFKQRMAKLDNLIESLNSFHDALQQARLESVKAVIRYRKEKKGERFPRKKTEEVCPE